MEIVNIRLLKDQSQYHKAGHCVKANISTGGFAMLVLQPYIVVPPEEYELVVSKDVFDRLLNQ